jgi:2,5-diamino-6-(ribosylamino)-4(3H)-pyrimidinone 5'-phosphate reductase
MLPKIIIHNSISLDGSYVHFIPNMELHYHIAGTYKPDAHLIGSRTVKMGVDLYSNGVPKENMSDFQKPTRETKLPYWVVVDSKGTCKGILHIMRRFEYNRDIIVIVTEQTPKHYITYLTERNYDYLVVGKKRVNLKKALERLQKKYRLNTILTDTGKILGNMLLNEGLATEISLLVHPIIIGEKAQNLFSDIHKNIILQKKKCDILEKGYIWLVYTVKK